MVFIIILTLSFLLQLVLPWWIIALISFVTCGLIGKTGKIALWSPFFAILLAWLAMALFKSLPNNNVLAIRVAEMFGIHTWWLLLMLTVLLGAFTAAISGYCGYHFRKAVLVAKTKS